MKAIRFNCAVYFLIFIQSFGLSTLTSAATINVDIVSFSFSPNSSTINVNDTVQWTQVDTTRHSSTSDAFIWDSGLLSSGQMFPKQFTSVGNFPYHCSAHSFMLGSVTVQAAANTPPTVNITSPAAGTVFTAPASFTVNANATDSDGTVSQVEFFVSASSIGIDPSSPYSATTNGVPAGNYTLAAVATDNQGAKTTNSISVIVNNPPTTSITNIVNGSVFAAGSSIQLKAIAADSDGTVTQVQFFNGAILLGTVTGSPYNFTLSSVTNGNYAFTTRATDNRGAVTTSPTINAVVTTITLLSATVPVTGQFQFNLSGLVVGKTNLIQFSSNLGSPTNWTSIKTNIAVATTTNFLDTAASALTPRFYRVIELP